MPTNLPGHREIMQRPNILVPIVISALALILISCGGSGSGLAIPTTPASGAGHGGTTGKTTGGGSTTGSNGNSVNQMLQGQVDFAFVHADALLQLNKTGKFNVVVRRGPDGAMQVARRPIPPMRADLGRIIEEMK